MDKFPVGWIWFGLAIAALLASVIAKGMAWLFSLLAIVFVVAGVFYLLRR